MAKLLLCHQFFWPDIAPYGSILRVIAEHWAESGHEVEVFTTKPSDARQVQGDQHQPPNNITIHRTQLPFSPKQSMLFEGINSLFFMLALLFHTLRYRKFDVVMTSTMPPLLAGLSGAFAAKISSAKFVYHLMDVYPEVIQYSKSKNKSKSKQLLIGLCKKIDSYTCNSASQIIVLSDDMQATLQRRSTFNEANKVDILPNFAVPSFSTPEQQKHVTIDIGGIEWKRGATRFLFAGNVGRFQGLDNLIHAFIAACKKGINAHLIFVGSGSELERLQILAKKCPDSRISFTGQLPRYQADKAIEQSDICIVSLSKNIRHVSYPTKTSSYLRLGKPLLAICEKESSIARLVTGEKVGATAELDNTDAIFKAIDLLCCSTTRLVYAENATRYGTTYIPSIMLQRWDNMLTRLLN